MTNCLEYFRFSKALRITVVVVEGDLKAPFSIATIPMS